MILYFDGAIKQKNPGGIATYGWVIETDTLEVIKTGMDIVGEGEEMTNNVAEYNGLLAALRWYVSSNIFNQNEKLLIRGDSALVCNMISKIWGWEKDERGQKTGNWIPHEKYPKLRALLFEILDLLKENNIKYDAEWIPREENTEADYLSKLVIKNRGLQI